MDQAIQAHQDQSTKTKTKTSSAIEAEDSSLTTQTANSKKANNIAAAFNNYPWLPYTIVVGLGGAAFMLLSLALLHFGLEYCEEATLIDPQSKTLIFIPLVIFALLISTSPFIKQMTNPSAGRRFDVKVLGVIFFVIAVVTIALPLPSTAVALTVTFAVTSLPAYLLLHFFSPLPSIRLATIAIWCFPYMAIWMIGVSAPLSLPIFIAIWAAIGFGGGLLLYSIARSKTATATSNADRARTQATNARTQAEGIVQTRRRTARTSGVASRYGRIPQDTVDLLSNHIRRITGPIAAALLIGASVSRRNQTVFILLDAVVSDWRENDNFDLMPPDDIDDFQSFIEAASFLCGTEENAISAAIYEATLKALAQDWLANWNVTDNSGPPERVY
jgi:hypothetical protein